MINGFSLDESTKLLGQAFGCVGKSNPKEYANAVKDLHSTGDVHKILEDRIKAIEDDPNLSRDEKETIKNKVIAQYQEDDIKHIQACADVIDRDANNRCELAKKIFWEAIACVVAYGAVKSAANGLQSYVGQLNIVPRSIR